MTRRFIISSGNKSQEPLKPIKAHKIEVLYQFPRVAITSYQKLDGVKPQKFILSQSWGPDALNQDVSRVFCSGGSQREPIMCLSPSFRWTLAVLGVPEFQEHQSYLHFCLPVTFSFVCLYVSDLSLPFFKDMCYGIQGPPQIQDDPNSRSLITTASTLFTNRPHEKVWMLELDISFGGHYRYITEHLCHQYEISQMRSISVAFEELWFGARQPGLNPGSIICICVG